MLKFFLITGLVLWLSALSISAYLIAATLRGRVENNRWLCTKTDKQRVLFVTDHSGAFQGTIETCVEWKTK